MFPLFFLGLLQFEYWAMKNKVRALGCAKEFEYWAMKNNVRALGCAKEFEYWAMQNKVRALAVQNRVRVLSGARVFSCCANGIQ
jgi:hypothetical protein